MKQLIRLTESDLHRIIKESIKSILYEDTRITYKGRVFDYKGDDNKEFKKLFAKFKTQVDAADAAERGETLPEPQKQKRQRKKKQEQIASETSPKTLALGVKNLIYDKTLNSVYVFGTHGVRSFGAEKVDKLFEIYSEKTDGNLFYQYDVVYGEIVNTVNEIENWGRKNEHAVYERAHKLAELLENLKNILLNLRNTTESIKQEGGFAEIANTPILVGRGNGRELGVFNLIFAARAEKFSKIIQMLIKNAKLLYKISDNGRNPFDYDPDDLRNRT
jgi:hypothetical protein